MSFCPTLDDKADKLLNSNFFALVLGMMLDQQIPLERAFSGPYLLEQRIGKKLTPKLIADMSDLELIDLFTISPSIHRFPNSMAQRTKLLSQTIVFQFNNKTEYIWSPKPNSLKLDAQEVYLNIKKLPGFGEQKAKIFLAVLAKQFEIKPDGWEKICKPYSAKNVYMSVADIDSPKALIKVREYKKSVKSALKNTSVV
jgi:uncharacterized HhH-GPD family protein